MVAMILTLILVSGVITIFISNKATYLTQDGLSRVQESGRFGLTFLSESLRWAGYSGCGNLDTMNVHIQSDPPPTGGFSMAGALEGYDSDTAGRTLQASPMWQVAMWLLSRGSSRVV